LFTSYTRYCNIYFESPTIPIEDSSTPIFEAMADKTLNEFSATSAENIHTGPTLEIREDSSFELKPSLINMVKANPFRGKAHEDASAHLQNYLEISSTIIIKDVDQDIILLCLFPFSLLGKAK